MSRGVEQVRRSQEREMKTAEEEVISCALKAAKPVKLMFASSGAAATAAAQAAAAAGSELSTICISRKNSNLSRSNNLV